MSELVALDAGKITRLTPDAENTLTSLIRDVAGWKFDIIRNSAAGSADTRHAIDDTISLLFAYLIEHKLWEYVLSMSEPEIRQYLSRAFTNCLLKVKAKHQRREGIAPMSAVEDFDELYAKESITASGARREPEEALIFHPEPPDIRDQRRLRHAIRQAPQHWVAKVAAHTGETLSVPPPVEPRPNKNTSRVALEYLPWRGEPLEDGCGGVLDQRSWFERAGGIRGSRTSEQLAETETGHVRKLIIVFCAESHISTEFEWDAVVLAWRRAFLPWKPEFVSLRSLVTPDTMLPPSSD